MARLQQKISNFGRRSSRVRARVSGSLDRPRLAVHISNQHVTAQLVDDQVGKTIAYVTTVGQKTPGNLTQKAQWVGIQVAKKAQKAKISTVVFDKSGYKFHGRVKALAEAAREGGLKF